MALQKKDFIEIEFTGKVKDTGMIFDSNIPDELKKLNPDAVAKPFVFSIGEDMFMPGVDEFLIGKEIGKYEIELQPEKAFGNRDSKLVQLIPINIFYQQKINPQAGMVFNFDGKLGKILSVSGGRVITDFNSPLAGKSVLYSVNILRKLDNINEKIKSLIDFFVRKEIPFKVEGKKLLVDVSAEKQKGFGEFLMLFKDKFKEMLDLDLEIKSKEEKIEEVKN